MAACPYCGVVLKRHPQRKTKCPSCGEPIYVRSGAPVTVARAETIDWLRLLSLTDQHFAVAEAELSIHHRQPAGHRDVLWKLLNESLLRDLTGASHRGVYQLMARFVHEEGRNHHPYLMQAHEAELRHWERSFPHRQLLVRIRNLGAHSCPSCAPLNGRLLSITEAQSAKLLPVATCTHEIHPRSGMGWCRCMYFVDFDASPITPSAGTG